MYIYNELEHSEIEYMNMQYEIIWTRSLWKWNYIYEYEIA